MAYRQDASTAECDGRQTRDIGKQKQRQIAFEKVIEFLHEKNQIDETVTLSELCTKMADFHEKPYTTKYMREKLEQHFGNEVIITNERGKPNCVAFAPTASRIIQNFSSVAKEKDLDKEKNENN